MMGCTHDECTYNECYECTREFVQMDNYECLDFEDYLDSKEYSHVFYRRVEHNKKEFKRKDHGKRIVVKGVAMYTLARDWLFDESVNCTEEITGLLLKPKDLDDPKRFNHILNVINDPKMNVNDLPDEPPKMRR